MEKYIGELNNDQLDGLAKLCFDLSKGSFLVALFPTPNIPNNPIAQVTNIIVALTAGVAFIYSALVLLKLKERLL